MVSNIYSQDDSVFLSLMRNKYDLLIHHQSSFVLIASEALELLISLTVQQKKKKTVSNFSEKKPTLNAKSHIRLVYT